MAGLNTKTDSLGAERNYLRSLPRAVLRNIATGHVRKAGSVLAGVGAAGFGGVVETISTRRTIRRPVLEVSR